MICGFSACVKNLFDERLLTHLGLTRCKPLHFKVKCACHVTCNYPDTEGRDRSSDPPAEEWGAFMQVSWDCLGTEAGLNQSFHQRSLQETRKKTAPEPGLWQPGSGAENMRMCAERASKAACTGSYLLWHQRGTPLSCHSAMGAMKLTMISFSFTICSMPTISRGPLFSSALKLGKALRTSSFPRTSR